MSTTRRSKPPLIAFSRGVFSLAKHTPAAAVSIPTDAFLGKRRAVVTVWESAAGWRWRMRATNGRIIADSGEGYTRRSAAIAAAHRLLHLAANARVSVIT